MANSSKKNPIRKPKVNPKLTVKQFKIDMGVFAKLAAEEFLARCIRKYEKADSIIQVTNQLLNTKVTTKDLEEQITVKDYLVFVKDGVIIDQITYKEFVSVMEYGRIDKGILPNPILRETFLDFKKDYKKAVANFLLGKRPLFK